MKQKKKKTEVRCKCMRMNICAQKMRIFGHIFLWHEQMYTSVRAKKPDVLNQSNEEKNSVVHSRL